MTSLNRNQKTILYLIRKLSGLQYLVEGRKKLMKLMFLVDHYDMGKKSLLKESFTGNKYIIYHFGVFSYDVMNAYISLNDKGLIKEYPIKLTEDHVIDLDEKTKEKVDNIIDCFGKESGAVLENKTLEMLKLSKETKTKHFGQSVKELTGR